MFDDEQRYLFDLQGWVTIPGALDPELLAELNAEFDRRVVNAVAPDANTHRFGDILEWGPAWLNLIDNPRVVDTLEAILGAGFRLDHDYADLIRRGKGPIGTRLHGGATPFDAGQSYAVHDGLIRSGLVVVAYNLRDVNPGDGGFAGVAGSHKANFVLPEDWKELEVDPPRPWVTPGHGPGRHGDRLHGGDVPRHAAVERRRRAADGLPEVQPARRSPGRPATTTATATPG